MQVSGKNSGPASQFRQTPQASDVKGAKVEGGESSESTSQIKNPSGSGEPPAVTKNIGGHGKTVSQQELDAYRETVKQRVRKGHYQQAAMTPAERAQHEREQREMAALQDYLNK